MNTKKSASAAIVCIVCSAFMLVWLSACGTTLDQNPDNGLVAPVIILKHSPIGTTELTWKPDNHELKVKIVLTGLAPKSSHAAHIHAGSCAVDGAVIYPLKPVVADAKGDGTSETTIENVSNGIPAQGWYINVHNGLLMSPIEHRAISCGNVSNQDANGTTGSKEQSVQVTMMGAKAPNESVDGKAEINNVNGKITLTITLTGLEPNSAHVAHIHDGSCEVQGPVLVMLKPVVANDKGIGTSVTTFDRMPTPKSSGLYINVHTGAAMTDLAQPTLFNPIACGNLASSSY